MARSSAMNTRSLLSAMRMGAASVDSSCDDEGSVPNAPVAAAAAGGAGGRGSRSWEILNGARQSGQDALVSKTLVMHSLQNLGGGGAWAGRRWITDGEEEPVGVDEWLGGLTRLADFSRVYRRCFIGIRGLVL